MAYTNEDKISLYQSISAKLSGAAAELHHFVDDADAEGDAENRTPEVADAAAQADRLTALTGKYLVRAKRLELDDDA